jgi:hypothetical protein
MNENPGESEPEGLWEDLSPASHVEGSLTSWSGVCLFSAWCLRVTFTFPSLGSLPHFAEVFESQ